MSQPDTPCEPSSGEPTGEPTEPPSTASIDPGPAGDAPPGSGSSRTEHAPTGPDRDDDRGTAGVDVGALDARLAAVERALVDGDAPPDGIADAAAVAGDVDEHAAAIDDLRERVDELAAATDALRGYVGEIRSVNEEVEGRATTAIERVDRLEARLDSLDAGAGGSRSRDERRTDERRTTPAHADAAPSDTDPPGASADETASRRARSGRVTGESERPRSAADASGSATGDGWTDEPLTDAFANGVVPGDDRRTSRPGTAVRSTSGRSLSERVRSWLRSE